MARLTNGSRSALFLLLLAVAACVFSAATDAGPSELAGGGNRQDGFNGSSDGASWAPEPEAARPPAANPAQAPVAAGDAQPEQPPSQSSSAPDAAAALAAAAEAADAGPSALSFSDLLNHLLAGKKRGDGGEEGEPAMASSPEGGEGAGQAPEGDPTGVSSTPGPEESVAAAVSSSPPPSSTRPSGPVDQGLADDDLLLASVKAAHGAPADEPGAQLSVQADGAPRNCASSCGTVYREHNLCTSGWEGQSALCGRGFRDVPGLEPRASHCLRCVSQLHRSPPLCPPLSRPHAGCRPRCA